MKLYTTRRAAKLLGVTRWRVQRRRADDLTPPPKPGISPVWPGGSRPLMRQPVALRGEVRSRAKGP